MKIAKMVKDQCCVPLCNIMTNTMIVVKIFVNFIFPGISKKESAHHHLNAQFNFSAIFMPVLPWFQIQNCGCMIRVYNS